MNIKVLKVIAVLLVVGVVSLSADSAKFAKRQASILERLDKKISIMNKFRDCVKNASNAKEIKSCRADYKSAIGELKKERAKLKNSK